MNNWQTLVRPCRWGATFLAAVAFIFAPLRADDAVLEIDIQCSPAVVNLASPANGTWFTVHADIAYSLVNTATVTLNGVPVKWTKVDNQGYLVAKFSLKDVRGLLAPGENLLTLSGTTTKGQPFNGSTTVKVL